MGGRPSPRSHPWKCWHGVRLWVPLHFLRQEPRLPRLARGPTNPKERVLPATGKATSSLPALDLPLGREEEARQSPQSPLRPVPVS